LLLAAGWWIGLIRLLTRPGFKDSKCLHEDSNTCRYEGFFFLGFKFDVVETSMLLRSNWSHEDVLQAVAAYSQLEVSQSAV
jgi:hypothetical protein